MMVVHMRNGRAHRHPSTFGGGETWCGKKLLGQPSCDGEGIETFSCYGADVRTTWDEVFVTCQRCLDAFETSYRRAFPDGPKPIATIRIDNPRAKELLGPETMTRFFGPNGEGTAAYSRFVEEIGAGDGQ